jgi:hypothetical protein
MVLDVNPVGTVSGDNPIGQHQVLPGLPVNRTLSNHLNIIF